MKLLLLSLLLAAPPAAQNVSEQYLLAAANQDRAEHSLPALRLDDQLCLAARLHAYEMMKRGTISHQFEGEAGLADRVGQAGAHFSLVTENVAEASNAAKIHELWMHSAGHRANLLDAKVGAVGIAVVQQNGQLYAVEDFANIVERLPIPAQEATVGALVGRYGVALDPVNADARLTCALTAGYSGMRRPSFVMRFTSSDLSHLPDELATRIASGRYRTAQVGACVTAAQGPFTSYSLAVLLYP